MTVRTVSILEYDLTHHAAHVHLIVEIANRRTSEMLGESGLHSAPCRKLIRQEGVYVMHRVKMRSGRILPREAHHLHPPLHLLQDPTRLFPQCAGRAIAQTDCVITIISFPLRGFAAPGNYKARRRR